MLLLLKLEAMLLLLKLEDRKGLEEYRVDVNHPIAQLRSKAIAD
jgi:hypothetical protein